MYDLIKKHEGLRLKAYKCALGVWTIGYGNTTINGRAVKENDIITEKEAEYLLSDYINKEILPQIKDLNLKGKQLDAFTSLCYNMGTPRIMADKDLINAIKNKDWKGVHINWIWGYINNLKGLRIRRTEELFYFMQDS